MVVSTIVVLHFCRLPITVVILGIELLELKFFDVLKEDYGITLHQLVKVLHSSIGLLFVFYECAHV